MLLLIFIHPDQRLSVMALSPDNLVLPAADDPLGRILPYGQYK